MIGELIPTGVTYGVGRISLNDQFSGTAEFNDVEVAGNLSAGTGGVIYSGGTDLYGIFLTNATDATTASNGLTKSGDNITLGGTLTGNTTISLSGTSTFVMSGDSGNSEQIKIETNFINNQPASLRVGKGSAAIYSESGSSSVNSYASASGSYAQIGRENGAVIQQINITDTGMKITDTVLTQGLIYDSNYHANYTNRSLIDKEYVDNTAATATTASNGLTKSGDNITLGGTLTGNTSIDVNGSYLNFVNTNPTTIAGDYKYRFLDGVTTPTIATENVSNYTEFKPITTGGAYQFASGVVMYANPSGNTNSEFYAGADLTLITTDLNKFQDSVAASLSILQFASNTGTFSGGFANAHTSTFRNLLSGNNIQNLAHYQAFGIETDGTNASVIDNLYGFYMRNSSDGNITNKWGVYIDDPNANNYFAGNVDVDGILTSGGTDLYNIFNTTAPSGGGVDSYINLGTTGSTINWNVSGLSTNYRVTLSAATTLNLTNVRNGEYGTIIVTQDGVGGRNLTFGTVNGLAGTHRVVNGGGGAPTLTSTASATDILSFTYNGSTMYWTVGNDYT